MNDIRPCFTGDTLEDGYDINKMQNHSHNRDVNITRLYELGEDGQLAHW